MIILISHISLFLICRIKFRVTYCIVVTDAEKYIDSNKHDTATGPVIQNVEVLTTNSTSADETPMNIINMENDWFLNGKKLNPDKVLSFLKLHGDIKVGNKIHKIADCYKSYSALTKNQKVRVAQYWEALKKEDESLPSSAVKGTTAILTSALNDEKLQESRNATVFFLFLFNTSKANYIYFKQYI